MKKICRASFNEIRRWVHLNAREVDLALWKYEYEEGTAEGVLDALAFYQNEDGGFGRALEADSHNLDSTPYTTLSAVSILKKINFFNTSHSIYKGIFKFLENGAHSNGDGWLFSVPSNNLHACAPWWNYDEGANQIEHKGVTAGLSCFILEFADKKTALYARALSYARKLAEGFSDSEKLGDMGLGGFDALLKTVKRLNLTNEIEITKIELNLKNRIDAEITRDVSQWKNYCARPSQFIPSPESPYYAGNEEIVGQELDYLIDTRPKDGVWGITWHWHGNYEKYPKEFAVSENWWKASVAIWNLAFLKNFGRLEV